jgi:hypothetical protein
VKSPDSEGHGTLGTPGVERPTAAIPGAGFDLRSHVLHMICCPDLHFLMMMKDRGVHSVVM